MQWDTWWSIYALNWTIFLLSIELLQISCGVIQKTEQRLRNEVNDDKEELVTAKENLGEQEDITRKASEVYVKQISTAQDITGDNYKGMSQKF